MGAGAPASGAVLAGRLAGTRLGCGSRIAARAGPCSSRATSASSAAIRAWGSAARNLASSAAVTMSLRTTSSGRVDTPNFFRTPQYLRGVG